MSASRPAAHGDTVASLLAEARPLLAAAPFGPSTREASLLLRHVLGCSEAHLLAHPETAVAAPAAARLRALLARRLGGEPVAYLLGEKEFYGRPFAVDRRVLIPRPETEHLVEAALEILRRSAGEDDAGPPRVLDVGTGSGAVAVTLALEAPATRVFATDLSPAALAVAAVNARRLGARVRFTAADLALGLELTAFDLVVANLPYVAPEQAPALSPEIRDHEPPRALYAEARGTLAMGRLLRLARSVHYKGVLALEIGQAQKEAVNRYAAPGFRITQTRLDYRGIPRVLVLEPSRPPRHGGDPPR